MGKTYRNIVLHLQGADRSGEDPDGVEISHNLPAETRLRKGETRDARIALYWRD